MALHVHSDKHIVMTFYYPAVNCFIEHNVTHYNIPMNI